MKETTVVHTIISSLKQRLTDSNNIFKLQLDKGYVTESTCKFNDPADAKELDQFITKLGYKLPEDYYTFLMISNGCNLFDHPEYGGESYLHRWQVINEITTEEPSEGYLKIGYIYQSELVIDLKSYQAGDNDYLLIKDCIDQFSESKKLNMNFEMWLDRFVISQGSKFWEWPRITSKLYYSY
ncbi:SMI1/KNR4 family protein [Cohnella terricola]|uniref:SMI1/KNR4 family protein n=1 Tax=Cohnella terricola TaxID=1289167 RepID=A0A559J8T6_9BACL|nr:SMI1/KNR4 family protein [Cohnella terricola]TVX96293.1 SMI1/KNR4 family protein [Cohnella terricola]